MSLSTRAQLSRRWLVTLGLTVVAPSALGAGRAHAGGAPEAPGAPSAPSDAADVARRVGEVEHRVLAPCCRRQNLADHDSPLARELRAEIERRAAAGEAPDAIVDDLVRRYGDDVRVDVPRPLVGVGLGVAVGLGAFAVIAVTRRARRRARAAEVAAVGAAVGAEPAAYAELLDDELAATE